MVRWIGAQGQVNSAKKTKSLPLVTSPTENPKLKTENFFQSQLEDFPNPKRIWTAL